MVDKIKEVPSVTKPLSSNGDARTVHPDDKKAKSVREHPHKDEFYKKVGTKSKQGGDGSERQCGCKDKSIRQHPHAKEGYSSVGKGDKSDARKAPASKNPFRNA